MKKLYVTYLIIIGSLFFAIETSLISHAAQKEGALTATNVYATQVNKTE